MKEVRNTTKGEFPVIITGEPTKIRIYRETKHASERFVLTHYDCFGQRQRRTFGTFEEADSEASNLKKEFKEGGWDLITLRGTERLAYQRAMEMLHPLGIPLDHAVLKLVEAFQVLGTDQVVEAARHFRQHSTTLPLPRNSPIR